MTRTLVLMRHAKSSWANAALMDHDRPLNGRGKASARAMGAWLRQRDHLPDFAISSTSERTGQTFLELGIDVPVRFSRALYHAEASTMMMVLKEQTEQTVLMLGHNPGIGDFAERLVEQPPQHPRFWTTRPAPPRSSGLTWTAGPRRIGGAGTWSTSRCRAR